MEQAAEPAFFPHWKVKSIAIWKVIQVHPVSYNEVREG